MTKRSPLTFFVLVFSLSTPFWWIGNVTDLQLMPGLSVSVLMAFCPMIAMLYLATLTAYRVLMTWMFAHTGSLLLAVLLHASYTGWLFVLFPATSFEQGLAWQTTLAAALWLVVAVVIGVFGHPRRAGARRWGSAELES